MGAGNIQFPQSPIVDMTTGYCSLEWILWFQNPQFVSINIGTVLGVGSGGTGLGTFTTGDLIYANGTTSLTTLKDVAVGSVLISGGVGVAPLWGKVSLSTVSGVLPIANGGTNSSTTLTGSSIAISNGNSIVQGQAGTTTTVLHGNNAGVPTYGAVVLTTDVSGVLPSANGGNDAFQTYTPTRFGWTDVGSPTVTARFTKNGHVCFFEVQIVPGTTTATVAGTSYITLPVTAAGLGGDGSMENLTTLIGVGGCAFDIPNSRVYVPTQTGTANTLVVSGWFEC